MPETDASDRTSASNPLTRRSIPVGPWDPRAIRSEFSTVHALFVRSGMINREHIIPGRTVSDLLGAGDLLSLSERLTGPPLPRIEIRLTVLEEATVLVIDDPAVRLLCEHPEIGADLVVMAADQTARLAALRALGHLPRVEQRLLAFFSVMAERFGRVTRDGIVIPLASSHEMLGHHVGAQRSTVSLALKLLADQGLLVRRPNGSWLLPKADAGESIDLADVAPGAGRVPVGVGGAAGAEPGPGPALAELRKRVARLRDQYDRARHRIDQLALRE